MKMLVGTAGGCGRGVSINQYGRRGVGSMAITVDRFLGLALDSSFEFAVYDFSREKIIFESQNEEELPIEIGGMFVESWDANNGRIGLNVGSGDG